MSGLSDKNRQKAEERILKTVTIKCEDCGGQMISIQVLTKYMEDIPPRFQSTKDARIGYSCEDCSHYYLFN